MFSISLYKLCDASAAAAFARENGAIAHGLISVAGVPRAPSRPIMWMRSRPRLTVVVAEQHREIGDDLLDAMARLLRTFFRDVRRVAPGLADFHSRVGQVSEPQLVGPLRSDDHLIAWARWVEQRLS